MFAYCNNNPTIHCDPCGYEKQRVIDNSRQLVMAMALGAAAGIIIATPIIVEPIVYDLAQEIAKAKREVYEYAKSVVENINRKTPHVHHIVPAGDFSSRSTLTRNKIKELHQLLKNAGINRFIDPINLMVVSAETHATLHTDAYIAHVHSYLMATDGSKEQIYAMLLFLRLEIAAMDQYAWGF